MYGETEHGTKQDRRWVVNRNYCPILVAWFDSDGIAARCRAKRDRAGSVASFGSAGLVSVDSGYADVRLWRIGRWGLEGMLITVCSFLHLSSFFFKHICCNIP